VLHIELISDASFPLGKKCPRKIVVFKCLLDHADDAPLAINSVECFKWSEGLLYHGGLEPRAPLVEPYCKKSNISDTN